MTSGIICHCLKTTKSLSTSIFTAHTWAQNSKATVFLGPAVSGTHKSNSYCDTVDKGNAYVVSILTSWHMASKKPWDLHRDKSVLCMCNYKIWGASTDPCSERLGPQLGSVGGRACVPFLFCAFNAPSRCKMPSSVTSYISTQMLCCVTGPTATQLTD
jgi:hypothetical protein